MFNGIIYKTTNLINGKIYVGKDEKDRPNYFGSGIHYKLAEKKYGKENFVKDVIDYGENRKDLCLKEIGWVKHFRELGLELYNMTDGGEGGDTLSNHPNRENIGRKISLAQMGKHLSEETSAKISATLSDGRITGENSHMYGKRGELSPLFGTHLSEEHKQKISVTMSDGRMAGEKHPKFGKHPSEETRAKFMGQNNPMSKTNREKRKAKLLEA